MAFLKTILIILLVYYLLKIVGRLFAPKILSYAARKTESRFRQIFEGFDQTPNPHDDDIDDIIIDKKPNKKKGNSEKVGEYIDFEELD